MCEMLCVVVDLVWCVEESAGSAFGYKLSIMWRFLSVIEAIGKVLSCDIAFL